MKNETQFPGFKCHGLGGSLSFYTGRLPKILRIDGHDFESLWQMHPTEYHKIRMIGRFMDTPRWQQAYGVDYYYTGRINVARPVPPILYPLLEWAKENIDERLNGILVNWYDGTLKHYIGRHRDSVKNMILGTHIVTVSFGEERIFRLRQLHEKGRMEFLVRDGDVFIMPYETNLAWAHEVPHFSRFSGRRISVTLRGFMNH